MRPHGVYTERRPRRGTAGGAANPGASPALRSIPRHGRQCPAPHSRRRSPTTAGDAYTVGPPTQQPAAHTDGNAPPPPPIRPAEQPTPSSRGSNLPWLTSQEAAPELLQQRPASPASSAKLKATGTGGRGSRLRRHLPTVARQAPFAHLGWSPGKPAPIQGVANDPPSWPP